MNKNRPININPLSVKLPIGALVSITHRLSGILVFLLIPLLLWALQLSLVSPEGFNQVADAIAKPWIKSLLWLFLAGMLYHLVAGVRHLLMDIHLGDSLETARFSAKLTIAVSLLLIIATTYWLYVR